MADDKDKFKIDPNSITLDMSLDDIEDMPGFGVFPTGVFLCTIPSIPELKPDVGGHQAFEFKFKLDEVAEMQGDALDEGEDPPIAGQEMSLVFMKDNKLGLDQMKKFLKPYAEKLGTKNLGEIFTQMANLKVLIVVKRTYNKEKDRHYARIKKTQIV